MNKRLFIHYSIHDFGKWMLEELPEKATEKEFIDLTIGIIDKRLNHIKNRIVEVEDEEKRRNIVDESDF